MLSVDVARLGGKQQRELILGSIDAYPTIEEILTFSNKVLEETNQKPLIRKVRMNPTRCKMRLTSIAGGYYATDKGRTVTFVPVSADGSEENKKFFNATPSGELKLNISAIAAESLGLDQGRIGSEFYVDITPVK